MSLKLEQLLKTGSDMEHPSLKVLAFVLRAGLMSWDALVGFHAVQSLDILTFTPEYCGCGKPAGNELISLRKHLAIPFDLFNSKLTQTVRKTNMQILDGKS